MFSLGKRLTWRRHMLLELDLVVYKSLPNLGVHSSARTVILAVAQLG